MSSKSDFSDNGSDETVCSAPLLDSSIHRTHQGLFYEKYKYQRWNQIFNKFIGSPYFLLLTALLCFVGFAFSQELVFYTECAAIGFFISLFARNIGRALLLVPFFYITPSSSNNPAVYDDSIFHQGSVLIYLCILAFFFLIGIFTVAVRDIRRNGFKVRPHFLLGFIFLGAAYVCSGLLTEHLSLKNLVFAFGQIASLCILYFIALYVVDWNEMPKETFAWIGVSMGLVLLCELVYIYLFNGVFDNGYLNRNYIYAGWGIQNNMGNMLCFCIPSAFYLIIKSKHKIAWLLYAYVLYFGVIATTSRGAILTGAIIFVISLLFIFFGLRRSKWIIPLIILSFLVAAAILLILIFLYREVDYIRSFIDSRLDIGIFNDSARFEIWKRGVEQFFDAPIFGKGFYECSSSAYGEYSKDVIPPRWHNTIVQILASCGIVGILAYGFHRMQTIAFFIKYKTNENFFIAMSILAILIGSLLDNHLFNLGPGLIYGMFLALAEGTTFCTASPRKCSERRVCASQTTVMSEKDIG